LKTNENEYVLSLEELQEFQRLESTNDVLYDDAQLEREIHRLATENIQANSTQNSMNRLDDVDDDDDDFWNDIMRNDEGCLELGEDGEKDSTYQDEELYTNHLNALKNERRIEYKHLQRNVEEFKQISIELKAQVEKNCIKHKVDEEDIAKLDMEVDRYTILLQHRFEEISRISQQYCSEIETWKKSLVSENRTPLLATLNYSSYLMNEEKEIEQLLLDYTEKNSQYTTEISIPSSYIENELQDHIDNLYSNYCHRFFASMSLFRAQKRCQWLEDYMSKSSISTTSSEFNSGTNESSTSLVSDTIAAEQIEAQLTITKFKRLLQVFDSISSTQAFQSRMRIAAETALRRFTDQAYSQLLQSHFSYSEYLSNLANVVNESWNRLDLVKSSLVYESHLTREYIEYLEKNYNKDCESILKVNHIQSATLEKFTSEYYSIFQKLNESELITNSSTFDVDKISTILPKVQMDKYATIQRALEILYSTESSHSSKTISIIEELLRMIRLSPLFENSQHIGNDQNHHTQYSHQSSRNSSFMKDSHLHNIASIQCACNSAINNANILYEYIRSIHASSKSIPQPIDPKLFNIRSMPPYLPVLQHSVDEMEQNLNHASTSGSQLLEHLNLIRNNIECELCVDSMNSSSQRDGNVHQLTDAELLLEYLQQIRNAGVPIK
jgi:hypothetical protein